MLLTHWADNYYSDVLPNLTVG